MKTQRPAVSQPIYRELLYDIALKPGLALSERDALARPKRMRYAIICGDDEYMVFINPPANTVFQDYIILKVILLQRIIFITKKDYWFLI